MIIQEKSRYSPLSYAIQEEKYQIVHKFLKDCDFIDKQQDNCLLFALKKMEIYLVKDLLQLGFNPNIIDENGESALQNCFRMMKRDPDNMIQIAHLLLIAGANPNYINPKTGFSVLHQMVIKNNQNAVDFIIKYNIHQIQTYSFDKIFLLNQRVLDTGDTALHLAIRKENINILIYLIENCIGDLFDCNWRQESLNNVSFILEQRKKRIYQSGFSIENCYLTMIKFIRQLQRKFLISKIFRTKTIPTIYIQTIQSEGIHQELNEQPESSEYIQEKQCNSDSCPSIPDDNSEQSPFGTKKIKELMINQETTNPTNLYFYNMEAKSCNLQFLKNPDIQLRLFQAETSDDIHEIDEMTSNQLIKINTRMMNNIGTIDAYNKVLNKFHSGYQEDIKSGLQFSNYQKLCQRQIQISLNKLISENELQIIVQQLNGIRKHQILDIEEVFAFSKNKSLSEIVCIIILLKVELFRIEFIRNNILKFFQNLFLQNEFLNFDDEIKRIRKIYRCKLQEGPSLLQYFALLKISYQKWINKLRIPDSDLFQTLIFEKDIEIRTTPYTFDELRKEQITKEIIYQQQLNDQISRNHSDSSSFSQWERLQSYFIGRF